MYCILLLFDVQWKKMFPVYQLYNQKNDVQWLDEVFGDNNDLIPIFLNRTLVEVFNSLVGMKMT